MHSHHVLMAAQTTDNVSKNNVFVRALEKELTAHLSGGLNIKDGGKSLSHTCKENTNLQSNSFRIYANGITFSCIILSSVIIFHDFKTYGKERFHFPHKIFKDFEGQSPESLSK